MNSKRKIMKKITVGLAIFSVLLTSAFAAHTCSTCGGSGYVPKYEPVPPDSVDLTKIPKPPIYLPRLP